MFLIFSFRCLLCTLSTPVFYFLSMINFLQSAVYFDQRTGAPHHSLVKIICIKTSYFGHFFFNFLTEMDGKTCLRVKKFILTREQSAEQPFAGQNTQQHSISIYEHSCCMIKENIFLWTDLLLKGWGGGNNTMFYFILYI